MLTQLDLDDFVLFEKASIPLCEGLNVISGETGAGKSLIAAALSLALGERANTDYIRAECEHARLQARFSIPDMALNAIRHEHAFDTPLEADMVFERQIRRDGRSRLFLDGQSITANIGRTLANRLVDMAAQNEHTRLLEPVYQRELLDRYGGLAAEAESFSVFFRKADSLRRRIEASDSERESVRRRLEYIEALLKEIEDFHYDADSDPLLEDRIRVLGNAESIRALTASAVQLLYEEDGSVQDVLGGLRRETEDLGDLTPHLQSASGLLDAMLSQLEEAVDAYRDAEGAVESSPGELESAIDRSEELKRLARRLGCIPADIPEQERRLRQEAAELSEWAADTTEVKTQLDAMLPQLADAGLQLRRKRQRAGAKLAKAVDRELAELDMDGAGFRVDCIPLWDTDDDISLLLAEANGDGLDEIVFRLSPNPGEASTALAENASGGEMSRAMLAIKSALASAHNPPVLFFDEIDTGIGGRLGDTVGKKLRDLARTRQVIVITHLPQIAAHADRHIHVAKKASNKRTVATARVLEDEERVEEIAQMIRGAASTEITRKQAREMLQHGCPPRFKEI